MVNSSSPVFIQNSEVKTLSSKSVGQDYRIFIALPKNYANSNDKYPVLYVLDADMAFATVTDLVRCAPLGREIGILGSNPFYRYVPNLIVVGIGYPVTWFDQPRLWWSLRTRDETPTENLDDALGLRMEGTSGGNAGKFLRFMRDELMPCVNSNYRTDPNDSTIVGHSGGGLFGLYVLFHQPETFRLYVASSPSLWWDNKVMFEYEREYASKHTELPAKLWLSAGSLEHTIASDVKRLVEILEQRKYKGLEWESHVFEGEDHISVWGTAICRGISSVFSKSNTKTT
jgi:predicted alpha/beta superfamily hydrolase